MTGISEEEEMEMELLQLNRQTTTQTQTITTTTRQYYEDPPSNRLQGLHNIQLDPELFNHLDEQQQQQQNEDICVLPPKVDTIRAIAERLRTIPPPGTLVEIMEWMERTTGHMGLFQPFFNDDDNDTQDERNQILLTPSGEHFQGGGWCAHHNYCDDVLLLTFHPNFRSVSLLFLYIICTSLESCQIYRPGHYLFSCIWNIRRRVD